MRCCCCCCFQDTDEWVFTAMVVDRFLLWIYFTSCLVGATGILLNAPALYDTREVIGADDNSLNDM